VSGGSLLDFEHDGTGAASARLLHELTNGSGASAIAPALESFRRRWGMRRVVAVVVDGHDRAVFVAGSGDWPPPGTFDGAPGVHVDPIVPEAAAEQAVLGDLCRLALQLERLSEEAVQDPMTGLYNRRGFDEMLNQAVSRSARYEWSFALVLFDVDNFKVINDTKGHPYGDEVLRQIGQRLRAGLRGGDIAARLGGDEFALLLADADADAAPPVLERLTVRTAEVPDGLPVGLSAGAAACPGDASSAEALYLIADQRLYRTKAIRKGLDPDQVTGR